MTRHLFSQALASIATLAFTEQLPRYRDFLATWNCKHLANANKFDSIARINGILGLAVPKLVTPLELLGVDDSE